MVVVACVTTTSAATEPCSGSSAEGGDILAGGEMGTSIGSTTGEGNVKPEYQEL
jgi:hypothetical protein